MARARVQRPCDHQEFGRRILAAAGKSTNIELFPRLEKLGGNGPIMRTPCWLRECV